MVQNAVGRPVEGDDFFDRARETAELWSRLESDHVLLLAPRRVGKTSLMFHLRDRAGAEGFRALYVSVADAASEGAFVRKLFGELERHGARKKVLAALRKSSAGNLLRRVRRVSVFSVEVELADAADANWAAVGESIAAALQSTGDSWLLLIDEVPIFVLNLLRADPSGLRARTFLNWFRNLRQGGASRRVRWFVAGSIGLDTVTRRLNLGDTINDFYLYTGFGAFDRGTAEQFLRELDLSYGLFLGEDVIAALCDRAGWLVPFHLQLMFAELRELCDGRRPVVADVGTVYERLLSPAKRGYFDYWEQRLHEELGAPDDDYAIRLLGVIAADDAGVTMQTLQSALSKRIRAAHERDARLRYLLDVLCSDGYIVAHEGRHRFQSALLREFWRRHAR